MVFVLVLLLIFILWKFKFFGKDFNSAYLDKGQTDALNGIFIFIVLISHMRGYLPAITGDWAVAQFCSTLGQMMVTSFMFISGYGCTVSYLKKGSPYINAMPRNRILPVLLNFDIAVLIYWLLMHFVFKKTFSAGIIIASLFGWESIGNSNWYIFAILCLYIIFYISFKFFGKSKFGILLSLVFLTLVFIKVVECFKGSAHWFYDTAFCFTFGVFYAYYKDKIWEVVTASNIRYLSLLAFFLAAFIYMNITGFGYSALYFNMYAVCFVCLMILVMMKVKIGNKILAFFGSHVFEIYIYQRIPMILLSKFTGLTQETKYYYIFFAIVLVSTCLIAYVMKLFYGKVDGLLKSKR